MLLTRDDHASELGLISASFSLCYIGCICLLPLYFEAGVILWGRLTAGFFGTYFHSMVFFHDSWSDVVNITFIVYWDLIFAFLNSLTSKIPLGAFRNTQCTALKHMLLPARSWIKYIFMEPSFLKSET